MDSRGYQSTVIKSKDRAGFNMRENKLHRYVGQPMLRREDRRLLIGKAIRRRHRFAAYAARCVHSQLGPHARIKSVDLSRAAAAPGVAFVLSGADLRNNCHPA